MAIAAHCLDRQRAGKRKQSQQPFDDFIVQQRYIEELHNQKPDIWMKMSGLKGRVEEKEFWSVTCLLSLC